MSAFLHFANSRGGAQASPPPGTDAVTSEGYIVGCDLGQANDFTALSILEKLRDVSSSVVQKGFEAPAVVTSTKNVFHLRHL